MDNSIDEQRGVMAVTVLGWLAIACLVMAGLEVTSYVFLRTYASSRVSYLTYQPPALPSRDDYEDYLARRHPELGWPGVDDEASGTPRARNVPLYAASADECITAYGDSYVFGDEVRDAEACVSFPQSDTG